MPTLLDTCIVYDWLMGAITDTKLIKKIQLEGALVSPVSVWEMVIKNSLGKMPLPSVNIAEDIEAQGFRWLNISPYHTQALVSLYSYHNDPFDRLLIAQASYEKLCVVTYDLVFKDYLDSVIIIKK